MVRLVAAFALLAACASPAAAFAPSTTGSNSRAAQTSLAAEPARSNDGGKQFAAAVVASTYLLSGLAFGAEAALADSYSTPDFGGTTTVLAGKSGGRAGGRVASGGPGNARTAGPPSVSSRSTNTVTNTHTTVIQQAPVVVQQPTVVMAPPMYSSPAPGLGLAMGINAVGAIGEGMREARQEREIAQSKAEVMVMRQKEADMENRLRMMEQQQMMGQQNMMNQQMLSNQLQMQAAMAK
uniref:Uncharacterized protein n=1 Tax=Odontella aurita TaxID=265563 RepID=A0A7S4NGA3_9STRA|mmetsp:Transcript_62213/g.183984  ORF Transcript_62213/g.183984 Transcript_62213/m.183984 type:complete len:238 (+) Transcript_62213:85-798(+)